MTDTALATDAFVHRTSDTSERSHAMSPASAMPAPVPETPAEAGAAFVPPPAAAPPRKRDLSAIVRLASIVLVIGAWEVFGRQINPLFMSYPSAIVRAGIVMAGNGELLTSLLSSCKILLMGFLLAVGLGVVFGLLIGRYRYFDAATDWFVNALYATPLVALIPLVTLWFGLGDAAKLFIVTLMAIFPMLINTAAGVRDVPRSLIEVSDAFAANEWQVFRKIILPSAVPFMMTGVRLAIGRAIIAMVVAEFFTAITGLGALIVKYGNQYDTASMFVPILLLMAMGVILTSLAKRAEQMFAPWRGSKRDG
ncbi:ABC transporter permease [Novosphingobium sp. 9]|uniref:ABC transporter permease n=1 Tax=Novosphingobium sp. 9 TaxID=2025349 RepID=UPI0021B6C6A6|nr:ABC transporter permease [Novosphingobium sp. 9]